VNQLAGNRARSDLRIVLGKLFIRLMLDEQLVGLQNGQVGYVFHEKPYKLGKIIIESSSLLQAHNAWIHA
jgi:hypothetical protein